jgi:hypothetical protein
LSSPLLVGHPASGLDVIADKLFRLKQILEDAAGFNGGSRDNVIRQFAAAQANNLNVVRMFGFGTAPRFALQPKPVRAHRHNVWRYIDVVCFVNDSLLLTIGIP